eukprot:Platyproteum_vivax@DN6995_c0_g1_i1.p1
MHGVRRSLVQKQAEMLRLPLIEVFLPSPCPNGAYEKLMWKAIDDCVEKGGTHVAFGDIALQDVKDYRIRMMEGTGMLVLFPLWGLDTSSLATQMIQEGVKSIVTCVNPTMADPDLVGQEWNETMVQDLSVDRCGENGEFHTFCYACPAFKEPVQVMVGDKLERGGMSWADLTLL